VKITLFGATGKVGRRILDEALSRGHSVTAVVRDPSRASELPAAAAIRVGDVLNASEVAELTAGQDLAISATRPPAGQETELVTMTRALLKGVGQTGVRLLISGGAATLSVPNGTTVLDDPRFLSPAGHNIGRACVEQLEACLADKHANWTYLSPPASLQPGARTGKYRLGCDELLLDEAGHSAISMEDLAVALLDEAEEPRHQRVRFTAAY
jgi:putative NADH-flavin reductase